MHYASPFSNINVNDLFKKVLLITNNGYYAFLAFGLSFQARVFNLSQHQAVEALQNILIPWFVLHIDLVYMYYSHLELCRRKFFEDFFLSWTRFQRVTEINLQGSDQSNVEFAAGVLFTDEDLKQPTWFLYPRNESFRSQELFWHITWEEKGQVFIFYILKTFVFYGLKILELSFLKLIKFHEFLITSQMCQL